MWEIALHVLAAIIVAIIFVESAGYFAHVFLHSHKYKWLSEGHMLDGIGGVGHITTTEN